MYSSKVFTAVAVGAAVLLLAVAAFQGWDVKYYEVFATLF